VGSAFIEPQGYLMTTAPLLLFLLLAQTRLDLTETSIWIDVSSRCVVCNNSFDFSHETPSGTVCEPDFKRLTGHEWDKEGGQWVKRGSGGRAAPETGTRRVTICERWFGWLARAFR
jgi:hypothetical protein